MKNTVTGKHAEIIQVHTTRVAPGALITLQSIKLRIQTSE